MTSPRDRVEGKDLQVGSAVGKVQIVKSWIEQTTRLVREDPQIGEVKSGPDSVWKINTRPGTR